MGASQVMQDLVGHRRKPDFILSVMKPVEGFKEERGK